MNPRYRRIFAWILLVLSIIGTPIALIWFAAYITEIILGLSFLAITLTAVDILATTDVRVQHEDEK